MKHEIIGIAHSIRLGNKQIHRCDGSVDCWRNDWEVLGVESGSELGSKSCRLGQYDGGNIQHEE